MVDTTEQLVAWAAALPYPQKLGIAGLVFGVVLLVAVLLIPVKKQAKGGKKRQ